MRRYQLPRGERESFARLGRRGVCPNVGLSHPVKNRANDSADYAALRGFFRWGGHVLHKLVGEFGDGQGLQPDFAGAGERGQEDAVAPEDHILDSGNGGDLERHTGLECADVARMHAQGFAGLKVLYDQLTREFDPGSTLTGDVLQQETVSAEDARAQGLLKADAYLDLWIGAQKAVAMNHVIVAATDFDGQDVARNLGGEGQFAARTDGAVL